MGKISDALDKFQNHSDDAFNDSQDAFDVITANDADIDNPVADTRDDHLKASNIIEKPFSKPVKKHHLNKNLVTATQPQSFEAEQFRVLKSKLMFPHSGVAPRSILVTSALPGEGKSFVSSNIAISIAQNINEHVLLMDCDVRAPSIHQLFGFGDIAGGLTDYLTRDIALSSLLLKTDINKLTLLPGGTIPDNPAELLASQKMSILVDELIERYNDRYIIIDSPPMNLTSETSVLAKLVEKIIVVVDYVETDRDAVSDLLENFEKEKVAGIILNKYDSLDVSDGYQKYRKNKKYFAQS